MEQIAAHLTDHHSRSHLQTYCNLLKKLWKSSPQHSGNKCCGSGTFIPDPGSEFFPSRIPGPIFFHPGSRISIKEFTYFNPKKWFISSRKYDPGCSSRIRILTFYPSPIPDPGYMGQKGTGSRIRNRNTGGNQWDNRLQLLNQWENGRTGKIPGTVNIKLPYCAWKPCVQTQYMEPAVH